MAEKETKILEIKVEQGDAFAELEKLKSSIVSLKEEQTKLTQAYKAGDITLEEYAKETVRVEQVMKRQATAYGNVTKSVQGTKSKTDELTKALKENTAQIQLGGTAVGGFVQKITALANPVTAAVGLVGALGAAYLSTHRGAEALEDAQFRLKAIFELTSERIADLIHNTSELAKTEDQLDKQRAYSNKFGAGAFKKNLEGLSPAVKKFNEDVKNLTEAFKQLDDLERQAIIDSEKITILRTQIDVLKTKRLEEKLSHSENLAALEEIKKKEGELNQIQLSTAIKRKDQLEVIAFLKGGENNLNEASLKLLIEARNEVSRLEGQYAKDTRKITKEIANINEAEEKLLDTLRKQNEELEKKNILTGGGERQAGDEVLQNRTEQLDRYADAAGHATSAEQKFAAGVQKSGEVVKVSKGLTDKQITSMLLLSSTIGGASAVFEKHTVAHKVFSSIQAGINSYLAGTQALTQLPFPVNIAAMITVIASGLAQQAKILGAFAGGGSFTTKGPAWLLVGDNPGGKERVDVTPVSGKGTTRILNRNAVAMGGGGSIDGGIVANGLTSNIDSQFSSTRQLLDNQPPIFITWKESVDFWDKMERKQALTEK